MKKFAGWLLDADAPRLYARPEPEVHAGCQVLYRGYIANFEALLEESKKRGAPLRGASTGELFAQAYHWWGEQLQAHVLGEYAVAVFDEQRSTLVVTHDSLGLMPLFICQKRDYVAFASHLEDLLRLTGYDSLDEDYIADYLATGMLTSERTPYSNIRRLVPGQTLYLSKRRRRLFTSWDITRIEPVTLANDHEYEERLRDLLQQGVTAALRSDGRVWCELSGGLDSSSVLCTAAKAQSSRLAAVSIIYSSSRTADESPWMKAVIRQCSLPWHTLDGDESKPFSELPREFCAEPANVLVTAGLFRRYKELAESNQVKTILSGYGGDQVFCGDAPKPYHLADLLPFRLRQLVTALSDWRASDRERRGLLYVFVTNVLMPSLRYWTQRSIMRRTEAVPRWIQPRYLRKMQFETRSQYQTAPRCRSVGQQYWVERIWRSGFIAGDEPSQPFEFRYPLLYRPLVEFMLAIPWEQRLQPGQDRFLQRRALKAILPEEIRQRSDKGGPAQAEISGLRNGTVWTDLLLNHPRIVERGYVDARIWREAVNQARFGRIPSMRYFLPAATLEVWLRQLENIEQTVEPFKPSSNCERMVAMFEAN